jgi:hypothetical protein
MKTVLWCKNTQFRHVLGLKNHHKESVFIHK